MNKKGTVVFAALAFSMLSVRCGVDPEITVVPAGSLIVDVRTPEEFDSGHYPGAVNIPVDAIGQRLEELGEKDRPIVVYCRSGRRSEDAKNYLKRMGFSAVYNGGGFKALLTIPQSPKSAPH